MASKKCVTRYAHSEGITGLSFAVDGTFMMTCGSDGDVRVWKDLEDDDPKSHRVGESAYALVLGKDHFYVSTDTNSVLGYTLADGGPDGIVTRSSALFNHLALSDDGKKILAGSSDFSVKLVDVDDKSFKVFLGHDAPILGVALDPLSEFAVSSSCDGSVRVWKLAKQNCVKSWASVFPSSNEFSASTVLCRMSWQPSSGKLLGVPVGNTVKFYHRGTWDEAFTLKDGSIKESINCVSFSRCGRYVAAAFVDGSIVAWELESRRCLEKLKSAKGYAICSLEWNPNGKDIVFCDVQGRVGIVQAISSMSADDAVLGNISESVQHTRDKELVIDDDDDDENTFSISKIKAETVGLEDSLSDHHAKVVNTKSVGMASETVSSVVVQSSGPKLAEPQEPFQPGSTPTYYSHRFMVWNAVGIIRSYNTEDESSIDIVFHDAAVHHSLHLENSLGHTMADISTAAIVLACVAQSDSPSKLVCVHFATWDNSKEWTVNMPEGETVLAVAASVGWIAAATDQRHVRVFTVGGVERHILELPGPVVAMAASSEDRYLAVAYHRGIGFPGDQCLGLMLVEMMAKALFAITTDLPLSPKTTLSWLGFTDEETPCAADSNGVIRMFCSKGKINRSWKQIADTRNQAKGRSDHHFIVGLSEMLQHIRCIPCKGAKYPATLPHPTVTVLPFRLPFCEIQSEKGQLEETFHKQSLMLDAASRLDGLGYETDPLALDAAKKSSKEALMKLFALSCRSGHEFRSVELAKLMDTSHTVQLAIKYASQVKRFQLAERLGQIAYEKMDEESRAQENLETNSEVLEEEDETEVTLVPRRQLIMRQDMAPRHGTPNRFAGHGDNDDQEMNTEEGVQEESQEFETQTSVSETPDSRLSTQVSVHRNNPFKVSTTPNEAEASRASVVGSGGDSKGIHLIDNLTKKSLARTPSVTTKGKALIGAKLKGDVITTPKTKSTTTKGEKGGSKSKKVVSEDCTVDETPPKPKSGVHMWLAANEDTMKAEHRKWMDKARRFDSSSREAVTTESKNENRDSSKRKRDGAEDDGDRDGSVGPNNQPKTSKLSAFSFNE